ncbi:MAG: zinc-binding dehydrogenase [Deltaproteobacteria bacterium]|nr:zinc-binding dehydrogenase [Deltaproteobacteria bacterium]
MSIHAEAWFIHAAAPGQPGGRARLVREAFTFGDVEPDEVLLEPLFGGWEANMDHALSRSPVDICRHRREERVVLGNSGVVRVLEVGRAVTTAEPGQLAVLWPATALDPFGYPELMWGYDAPGSLGCLATRLKCKAHELCTLPGDTRHALARWAAFSVKYGAAWSNWKLAHAVLRAQISAEELPAPHVWGFGGGTTLAELELARHVGCQTVMLSGNTARRRTIEAKGVTPLDRSALGDLSFDDERFAADADFRRAYVAAEAAFLAEVRGRTEGQGVHVFVDYIGSPTFRAASKALAREGVLTTAGWKEGRMISYQRPTSCIKRHQYIHTHGTRGSEAREAVTYAERTGWLPLPDERIFSFDEIPELADRYAEGQLGLFPIYRVHG